VTEVVLFHHAQGLTPGVVAFADALRAAGHVVHTPDLYEGLTFDSIDAGLEHVHGLGVGEIAARGVRSAADFDADVVYAGFSLGVLPAQHLAQSRPGARGALFFHSCVPAAEFGTWPTGLPVQVHGMEHDPFFVDEGDLDAARELVAQVRADDPATDAEVFVYPGSAHLFADSSLDAYDRPAADLLTERTLAFLARR
jgi:dienelactone hydrolase